MAAGRCSRFADAEASSHSPSGLFFMGRCASAHPKALQLANAFGTLHQHCWVTVLPMQPSSDAPMPVVVTADWCAPVCETTSPIATDWMITIPCRSLSSDQPTASALSWIDLFGQR
jgi:hypothetical protein